ncbi:MAG: hypothetical protein ACR2O6_08190 [Ilumatobacteraceae bacterium]
MRRVVDADRLRAMQEAVERVDVDESVGRYCVEVAAGRDVRGASRLGRWW